MRNGITSLANYQFARNVERVLALGPRPITELLLETDEQRSCRTYLEQRLRYAEIDPEHLNALNDRTFPRPPLHEVQRVP